MGELASWNCPSGGLFIWLRLDGPVDMRALFKQALRRGVLLYPGNIYDHTDNRHLRTSYGYAALPGLVEGIKRLAEFLHKQV